MTNTPIPMLLSCPLCRCPHVDRGEWATKPHRTHLCEWCGALFRPAMVPTAGVEALVDDDGTQQTMSLRPPKRRGFLPPLALIRCRNCNKSINKQHESWYAMQDGTVFCNGTGQRHAPRT